MIFHDVFAQWLTSYNFLLLFTACTIDLVNSVSELQCAERIKSRVKNFHITVIKLLNSNMSFTASNISERLILSWNSHDMGFLMLLYSHMLFDLYVLCV